MVWIYCCHQQFSSGDMSLDDSKKQGQSSTDERYVAKVKAVVKKHRRLLIRQIAKTNNLNDKQVWRILNFRLQDSFSVHQIVTEYEKYRHYS